MVAAITIAMYCLLIHSPWICYSSNYTMIFCYHNDKGKIAESLLFAVLYCTPCEKHLELIKLLISSWLWIQLQKTIFFTNMVTNMCTKDSHPPRPSLTRYATGHVTVPKLHELQTHNLIISIWHTTSNFKVSYLHMHIIYTGY